MAYEGLIAESVRVYGDGGELIDAYAAGTSGRAASSTRSPCTATT
jgi:hypothetical protein